MDALSLDFRSGLHVSEFYYQQCKSWPLIIVPIIMLNLSSLVLNRVELPVYYTGNETYVLNPFRFRCLDT